MHKGVSGRYLYCRFCWRRDHDDLAVWYYSDLLTRNQLGLASTVCKRGEAILRLREERRCRAADDSTGIEKLLTRRRIVTVEPRKKHLHCELG